MPRKPAALKKGDLVSLVAPAGPSDADRLERGTRLLESWGLRVRPFEPAAPVRYMAGGDSVRARDLEAALAADEVRGVLAVRGGYGSARLHDLVDLSAARLRPKLFVGYSDITILLGRLVQEADLVCYHGPMVAADLPRFGPEDGERFRRFLFGEEGWWDGRARESWRDGGAVGKLVGGCLSVLVTTLGTPYEIETEDSILFLEDVAEKPYRIDRMLYHMKHAGKFAGVRGVVFGQLADCDDGAGLELLKEIVLDVLDDHSFPILYGLDAGHCSGGVVVPLGCRARIDSSRCGTELLEPVFA